MNLTFQVRDGILSHDGEINEKNLKPNRNKNESSLIDYCKRKYQGENIQIIPATLEGCVVRISDSISYLGQDFEDAIRIGILQKQMLPKEIKKSLGEKNTDIIDTLVKDIIINSYKRDEIFYSDDVAENMFRLKNFNIEKIYRNENLKRKKVKLKNEFNVLFDQFLNDIHYGNENSLIFKEWIFNRGANKGEIYMNQNTPEQVIIDFIASMTDRYFYHALKKIIKNIN